MNLLLCHLLTSTQSPPALPQEALPPMVAAKLGRSPRVRARSFSAQPLYLPSHSDLVGLRHVVLTRPAVRPDTVSVRRLADLHLGFFPTTLHKVAVAIG